MTKAEKLIEMASEVGLTGDIYANRTTMAKVDSVTDDDMAAFSDAGLEKINDES